MIARFKAVSKCALAAVAVLALAACAPKDVSYSKDVQPILAKNCAECHAPGQKGFVASGLDTTSYQNLIKGGRFGPLIKPGDSLSSALNMLVEGRVHSSIQMPHGREKLPAKEIEILKVWVDEGAKNN